MRLTEIQLTERYYNGKKVRIIKAVKGKDGKIIQYKIEDVDKTWTDYVKPDQLTLNENEHGDPTCDMCGEDMEWCPVCDRYTSTCCVPYGTCMCS